jgi:hypothetical protein
MRQFLPVFWINGKSAPGKLNVLPSCCFALPLVVLVAAQ